MELYKRFRIDSIPSQLDKLIFMNAIGGDIFWIFHKVRNSETLLGMGDMTAQRIMGAIPGLVLNETEENVTLKKPLGIVSFLYKDVDMDLDEPEKLEVLDDLYRLLDGVESDLCLCFIPVYEGDVSSFKQKIEHLLSTKEIRQTKSFGDRSLSSNSTKSMQTDIYYESEEKKVLLSVLDTLNDVIISNYTAYRVLILCEDNPRVLNYLNSKLLIVDKFDVELKDMDEIFDKSQRLEAIPFSFGKIFPLISFSERIERVSNIKTDYPRIYGNDVDMGTYLEDSLKMSLHHIAISVSALNLGCLITGLPGSGKTYEAMNICKQVKNRGNVKMAILSPTDEWKALSKQVGLIYIRLYEAGTINFFRCDSEINIERFYENLAMLIASSSAAGPYRNSLEKCLLAAFRKIYAETRAPNPLEVYDTIERVIIEQHGTQVSSKVKYTKHGENIRAALENLRLLLFREEFSSEDGINFGKLINTGVVFDLSLVGCGMRPLLYGLILNQLYSFSDAVDTKGDSELRMLLLVEEAQLIFPEDDLFGATMDLKQRIQDFRKKGVGIMLISHNITDINSGIRRLCQNKLYFRQSVDILKYACADLGFVEEQMGTVMNRLKNLEQQVCVANLIEKNQNGNRLIGPIFLKADMLNLDGEVGRLIEYTDKNRGRYESMNVVVHRSEGKEISGLKLVLNYLWENVSEACPSENGVFVFENVRMGKKHTIKILDQGKGKHLKSVSIIAKENVEIHV